MKNLVITAIYVVVIVFYSYGQKKPVDNVLCNSSEQLEQIDNKSCLINGDGNCVMYRSFSNINGRKTIIKHLKSNIQQHFFGVTNENMFNCDKMFSFQIPGDSLVILDTRTGFYTYLSGVKWYFVIKSKLSNMLGYFTEKESRPILTIWNVSTGSRLIIEEANMAKYWLNKQGTGILTISSNKLIYLDLASGKKTVVTSEAAVANAAFNANGREIAYAIHSGEGKELRYFNLNSKSGKVLVSDSDLLKNNLQMDTSELLFDDEDGNVFFKVSKRSSNATLRQLDTVITNDVNVWSYRDLRIQDEQMANLPVRQNFITTINVQSGKMIQLESEEVSIPSFGEAYPYFILSSRVNDREFYWNNEKAKLILFSLKTGRKTVLKEFRYPGFRFIGVSPNKKALTWFDSLDGNYYSYDIANGSISNISGYANASFRISNRIDGTIKSTQNPQPYDDYFWMNNGNALIVNSGNDIWLLDVFGKKRPVNLTNGYGDRYNITFRLVESAGSPMKINTNDFLVTAFDNRTKQNGFWKTNLEKSTNPIKLIMSDDAYFFKLRESIFPTSEACDPGYFKPVKASNEKKFIVRIMSGTKPPNLYLTVDFKAFNKLSDIQINKEYVNVTSKLIPFTLSDGSKVEGILHIPENFDSSRKYPIIFNYYERRSEGFNLYRNPELSGHNINIPWYVSREYLVFEPDFYYKRGETAQSIVDCTKAAIIELSKLPYVDTTMMGAQGQSFGGYESNVLAVQTNLFKAVCAMAGPTNLISEYGSLRWGGINNQLAADKGQRNIGVFPWEKPEVFIKNSPNFYIHKTTTPLLLVHNKGDGAILFSQAVEMYMGMRRLNKKVWLLEYDGEGHDLKKVENKLDFTIRMQQFFDHYLKGAPAPRWMTRGIPASMKGIDSGLELDTEIKTPGEGIARPVKKGKIF